MITWIQRYFQHHFKTVFAILLVLIIISFVFITNASGGFGRGEHRVVDRPFFGYNLSLASDQQRLAQEAQVSFSINPNYEYYTDPQGFMLRRAAKLHLADQWHIPAATSAEITDAIKKLRMFTGPDGQFDAKRYQEFRDSLKTKERGITEADVLRVIGDDLRVEKVSALLAGPGFVSAADVKQNVKIADTIWTLGMATADYGAFKPEIKPTDAELTKAFEESAPGRYDQPARVRVGYIDFPAVNHLAGVTVTDAEVRQYYDSNKARFPNPAAPKPTPAVPGVTPPANPDVDFAIVRAQVETALKQDLAKKRAVQAGADFAVHLYQAKVSAANIDGYLAGQKLALKPLAPFTHAEGPAELGNSQAIADEAFKLTQERAISQEAIETPTGAAVLVWKELIPSRRPLFTEVRDKVQADYIESERQKRFLEAGRAAKAQLEARLKAGDAFDKAVAAVTGPLKLESKTIPAFSLRQPPQGVDNAAFSALDTLEQGKVSDFTNPGDKGVLVYAIEKKLPDLSESNPRYAETRKQLAASMGREAVGAYVNELVEKELERGKPKVE